MPDTDERTNRPLDVGIQDDKPGSPLKNDGFFENGLLKAMESDHVTASHALEVKVVANGHCHSSSDAPPCVRHQSDCVCSLGEL
jgi:hypothetical protein